jgi:iron complex transport system substrate-binding protein
MSLYKRIACLSTEATETLYALGAEENIAGISGFTVRPARARAEKPKISGFSSSKIERILAVQPDLVIGFSNLQADICRDLAKEGIEVHLFNQRSIAGILQMVRVLSAMVGRQDAGEALVAQLRRQIDAACEQAAQWERQPRLYFEEWNAPLMCGIGWVSEAIQLAGGIDVFADLACRQDAGGRIIADSDEVVRRRPDIILASWCGKKFQPGTVRKRPGWEAIPAVREDMLFEIKSPDILSPGPAAITEGLRRISGIIKQWQDKGRQS